MDDRYDPQVIEDKWQQKWAAEKLDCTDTDPRKPKFYALSMFPYPSGNLHMGHVRNYTITDVIARCRRMQGYRVLHPMGWDAFGLPAENAAIERGIHPRVWTQQNISQMRQELQRLGLSYDWEREVTTCDPEYYRWTQWLFLEFFEAGLAYQKEAAVNWDPVDQTVLANEQVDSEGRSWRSGALVERRLLKQWFLKITAYAEELLNDLEQLTGWPERVKLMQANWIGKSSGAYLEFPVVGREEKIAVFTTRPDTVYGVTYVVLAPEHPLTLKVTTSRRRKTVEAFIASVQQESELERTAGDRPKRGVATGGKALNPFTGEEIPIWIADYVLYEYGTGAVMGVPAHDERDFQFAKAHKLPIRQVIIPPTGKAGARLKAAYTEAGILINSGPFTGMDATAAKTAITDYATAQGWGREQVQYRLRDWLISRQRYWGVPIPIIHCPHCGAVPVPRSELPVLLPEEVEFTGRGPSPLAKLAAWRDVPCPKCGAPAQRETDTMDTFIDSSWYYFRYADARNSEAPFDPAAIKDWLPVDQYVGGIEHAILHLLYSRFFTKVLRDRQLVHVSEPFQRLLTQGMVQGRTYKNPRTGKYVIPSQIADLNCPTDPETGEALEVVYEKMSKSKYNGVAPGDVIRQYGADTARMFILFKAPPEKDLEWDDADVEGQFRFLNRVWRLVQTFKAKGGRLGVPLPPTLSKEERELRRAVHTAIKEISDDLEGDYQLNTAVAELMKLSNALGSADCYTSGVYSEGIQTLLTLLAPFAPHISEELWQQLGGSGSIHRQPWPKADPAALVAEEITVVIQVMGKTRGTLQVPATASQPEVEQAVQASDLGQRYLAGKKIKRVIFVPGKLINFVLEA
ncbi:leucine--tRNA ligase [uncultured Thermosynechococcus sp.]|uniref:leucine--tRNA ligase n=1 Tax=uncultured Thermosynechococcus sp. TaxID=436945 RepID=UPI00263219CE|nr:leucine--tRNA ligase [uncultured Thermosynechococcus sp.]